MAAERLSMRKTREILRLHWGLGLSKRQVARCCNVSHSTVVKYIERAERAGLSWPLPESLDDTAIERMLFPSEVSVQNTDRNLPSFEEIHQELRIKGVTLQLLWQEYKERNPEGYQYTQFCEHYRRWGKTLDICLRQEHRAGEKAFVDFAGKGIPIIDRNTGEIIMTELFVCVLGASNYTYAEALMSQSLPDWIMANINAFEYFGGAPEILVPDNLKAGVTKPCRYEPDINPTYNDMCRHYGTVAISTRVRRPKDKAKVEAGVLLVTRWITAALRHHTFFSREEVNAKVWELLEILNNRKFKKLDSTRRKLFESLDKPALKPLPVNRYQYAEWKKATVNVDYHIEVEGHFYSVPYQLVKQKVEVRIAAQTIEVLHGGKRVAIHQRSFLKGKFTAINEHRPKSHQKHLEWTPSRLINWAKQTGSCTAELVETIMATRPHPEQGFRSCMGIISLGKKYSPERLELAARRALHIKAYSYKSVKSILENGLDRIPLKPQQQRLPLVEHDNIRGQHYYQ